MYSSGNIFIIGMKRNINVNKKIEKKGFKAKIKIEDGINELIKIFTNSNDKIINNYRFYVG